MERRAAYYALALEAGLAECDEVHEWVNAAVMRAPEPPVLLLDLTMATNASVPDLVRLLRDLSDRMLDSSVTLAILGRMSREMFEGSRSPSDVIARLKWLTYNLTLPAPLVSELQRHIGDYILATEVDELDYDAVMARLEEWMRRFEGVEKGFLAAD